MLGRGARIGESLAVLWSQVDLDAATVDIPRKPLGEHAAGAITDPNLTSNHLRQSPAIIWITPSAHVVLGLRAAMTFRWAGRCVEGLRKSVRHRDCGDPGRWPDWNQALPSLPCETAALA
jgi:hypothetical protein